MKSILMAGALALGVAAFATAPAGATESATQLTSNHALQHVTDVSSAKKKKKMRKKRMMRGSGSSPAGTGGGAGGESGSGGTTERAKPRGKASTPAQ